MLPGYNHNLRHQGVLFHIQTEDTGLPKASIETHVFIEGNVIATRRSDYVKFASRAGLHDIVKSMMQEQHKQMMKDLVENKLLSVNAMLEKLGKSVPPQKVERLEVSQPQPKPPKSEPMRVDTVEKTLDELILEHISKMKG